MNIISGMHRSGTSLIARLFYEAGANMGKAEDFYPSDKWNPDGYFEQLPIYAINTSLVHGPWWKFTYFCLPSTRTILKRAEKHAEQIQRTASRYHGKIVKDPRFCLTLPAWLKCGVQIDKILVCIREPFQVAQSIQRRNLTTIGHALNLWYIHNHRLLENIRGLPQWFVYYKKILDEESFLQEMKPACQFLGYNFTDSELEMLRRKCVNPQMNHNSGIIGAYSGETEMLWKILLKRHKDQFKEGGNLW